jgi:hypothetical protein
MPAEVMAIATRLLGEGHTEREVLFAILHALTNHRCGKALSKKFLALLIKDKSVVISVELQASFKLVFDEFLVVEPYGSALPPERYDIPAFLKATSD